MKNLKIAAIFVSIFAIVCIVVLGCSGGGGGGGAGGWGDSGNGNIVVSLSGLPGSNSSVQSARVLNPGARTDPRLSFIITLTGPGSSIEREITDINEAVRFYVVPGEWTITVEAVYTDHWGNKETWAFGTYKVNVTAGNNPPVRVEMEEPYIGNDVQVFNGNWSELKALIEGLTQGDYVIKLANSLTMGYDSIYINEGQNVTLIADTHINITLPVDSLYAVFHINNDYYKSSSLTLGKPWMKGTITISGGAGTLIFIGLADEGDKFIMNDKVSLTGNNNGAVHVSDYGIFVMYGGNISGNSTTSYHGGGGGVRVTDSGQFHMYGGTISGNTAAPDGFVNVSGFGGGVYVGNGATFIKSGGTISGNTATGTMPTPPSYTGTPGNEVCFHQFSGVGDYNNYWSRNRPAGQGENINTGITGAAGGWE